MKNVGYPRFFVLFASTLVLLSCFGCKPSQNNANRGAGQSATAQDKARQNENLLAQVIDIAENQEQYPDPVLMRNSLGRLDSWLAEKPESEDFESDEEFAALEKRFAELAKNAAKIKTLVKLFTDESKTPEPKDGDEFVELLDSVSKETGELADSLESNALKWYSMFFADFKEQLEGAKEFQFDAVESFQTKTREFVARPTAMFFNCDAFLDGIESFRDLLDVDAQRFCPEDPEFLRESVWFRWVFSWAKGEKQDDMTIVLNLFDWSVRNIISTPPMLGPSGNPMAQKPWQTLLLGQGTAMDRAVVFMELLRQHRLDSFVLRPEGEERPDFPLVVGVRLNGEVYLFLPELGLPVPTADNEAVTLENGLRFNSIATLKQAAKDDAILRRFDLEGRPFPAKAQDFEKMVALVPSTPFTVASRMIYMEQEFSGSMPAVLSTPFESQKARVAEMDGIVDVKRLPDPVAPLLEQALFPYESEEITSLYMLSTSSSKGSLDVSDSQDGAQSSNDENINDNTKDDYAGSGSDRVDQPGAGASANKGQVAALWVGKILYLRGRFVDDGGASVRFLQARVSDRVLKQEEAAIRQRVVDYVEQYREWRASQNEGTSDEELNQIALEAARAMQTDIAAKRLVKTLTSFYLALLSEEAGNDSAALERLNDDSLRLAPQSGAQRSYGDDWRYAANYLRARILEKQGNSETAVVRLRVDPSRTGDLVRAQWIAKVAGLPTESAPEQPAPEQPAPEQPTE